MHNSNVGVHNSIMCVHISMVGVLVCLNLFSVSVNQFLFSVNQQVSGDCHLGISTSSPGHIQIWQARMCVKMSTEDEEKNEDKWKESIIIG